MTYSPGQAKELFKYICKDPEWFLLGGPADADEAQTMMKQYPKINVLAIEPSAAMCDWQMDNGFNGRHLLHFALSDINSTSERIRIIRGCERQSTMVRDRPNVPWTAVDTITLDSLDIMYGPFDRAVLWLDIEGMEYRALIGATKLLERGAIDLMNIEFMPEERPEETRLTEELFKKYKFNLVHTWNWQGQQHDRIYRRINAG